MPTREPIGPTAGRMRQGRRRGGRARRRDALAVL